jgi:poly [ADP-ribose] polymerase
MNQQMKEIGYDANKMPLGKLSQQMIKDGYEVLRDIEQVLKGSKKCDLYELSSRFYTIIPHNFGYQ